MSFLEKFRKPKATVMSTIPETTLELGKDLRGAITVSSEDKFDATELRAELRCVEKVKRERWEYDEERKREVRRVYCDAATLIDRCRIRRCYLRHARIPAVTTKIATTSNRIGMRNPTNNARP